MFADFIEKLRKKPEEARSLIVWVATAVIMGIIVILWLTFGLRSNLIPYSSDLPEKSSSRQEGRMTKILDIFDEVKGDFTYVKDSLTNTFGDFLSGKNDPEEIPPELQEYLPKDQENNLPMVLPKTD